MSGSKKCSVICLLWKGNFRGRDYNDSDVWRLYQSVSKHIDRDFDFYVLTNDAHAKVPGLKMLLYNDWPGWWSKIELFRQDMPDGKLLYMDLDCRAVDSLEPMLDYNDDLVMFPTKTAKNKQESKDWFKTDGVVWKYQASVMLFNNPSSLTLVYDTFKEKALHWMKLYRSEQDIYGHWLPDQTMWPGEWIMKLQGIKQGMKLNGAKIVSGNLGMGDWRDPKFAPWLNYMALG